MDNQGKVKNNESKKLGGVEVSISDQVISFYNGKWIDNF